MKHLLLLLFAISLFAGCDDDDMTTPNICEEIRERVLIEIQNENIVNYRFVTADRVIIDDGRPFFDGCLVEFRGDWYNLNQLVTFEVTSTTLTVRFV